MGDILQNYLALDKAKGVKHWGVKGMKWGVRKDRSTSGSGRKAARDRIRKPGMAKKPVSSTGQKRISDMTDEELRSRIGRFELEKRYREYTASDKVAKGNSMINDVLKTSGKAILTASATAVGLYVLQSALKSKADTAPAGSKFNKLFPPDQVGKPNINITAKKK